MSDYAFIQDVQLGIFSIPGRSRQKFWAPMLVIPHKVHNISRILAKTVFLCDLILGWEMEF